MSAPAPNGPTRDPVSVRCAWCGAAPGQLCSTLRRATEYGLEVRTVKDPHAIRVLAAKQLDRWERGGGEVGGQGVGGIMEPGAS